MPKETRQPFTLTGEYYARRKFRFHSRDFAPRDPFPWRQLSCSARKLRQLYEGRFIEPGKVPEETTETPEPVVTTPLVSDPVTEDTIEQVQETVEDSEQIKEPVAPTFKFNPKKHHLEEVGDDSLMYNVLTKRGRVRLSVTRKEAQRLKKVKKPTKVTPEEIVE